MVDARSMPYTFGGLKIYIDNYAMIDVVEDWSNVRSKGRAARRRKHGHPQNIVIRHVPKKQAVAFGDKIFMHSELYAELLRKMEDYGQSKSRSVADDLSFPGGPKSEVPKLNFAKDYLWGSGVSNANFSWVYSSFPT